jgi:hypothetical protein
MFTNVYSANIFRFFFLLLIQGLVLQYIGYKNIYIFIYPLFLMLLPLEIPHGLLVLLCFLMGISVDIFYNGFGLHASVMVALAFARPLILGLMEPRGGFEVGQTLSAKNFGFRWFIRYSSVICLLHMFLIILLEELSLSWFLLARISIGFLLTMLIILLYQFIFNPKI